MTNNAIDHYRDNMKRAEYDWREDEHARNKDRRNSRAEKRSARQAERGDIRKAEHEYDPVGDAEMEQLARCEAGLGCEVCGEK